MTRHDQHSFAEPADARVTHVAIDLTADFEAHVFSGTATLTVEAVPTAKEVVLDTKTLTIEGATDQAGEPLAFHLDAADPILGRALHVALPADRRTVVVKYRTSPGAAALQWLRPSQTAGGKHPVRLLARRGDPHAHVDPDAGQPRRPPDLRRAHRRACRAACGDERRAAHA